MRTLILISLQFVFFFSAYAQQDDEQLIRGVLSNQQDAWNEGNIEKFMKGYWQSTKLMFIGQSGVTYGWKKTLKNYKRNYPDKAAMGTLTFKILKVELLSTESAFVIGKWQLERDEDKPAGHFTLLWKKINGTWKIVADHSS